MIPQKSTDAIGEKRGSKAGLAIALVTALFFVWGLTMQLVNGLNSPLQNYLELSNTQASFLQAAYFGAYFVMAIPATIIAKRFGYKGGIIAGLALFVIGSFITVPATNLANFAIFLAAMFVIAAGAASLEANCNPYITKLGDASHESQRLNLAQSFNGIGSIVGPLLLALVVGTTVFPGEQGFDAAKAAFLDNMRLVYIVIGIVLALVFIVFLLFKLPEPAADTENTQDGAGASYATVLGKPHFVLGIVALFLYVGIQTVGFAQVANLSQDLWFVGDLSAGQMVLMATTILFTVGRFVSVPIMSKVAPHKLLGVYMSAAAVCFFVACLGIEVVSVVAVVVAFLFMSIGYPTIFSLALKGLNGAAAKTASSLLVMSIVGGALVPMLTGALADATSVAISFVICVPCIAYAAWYGFKGSQIGIEAPKE